MEDCLVTSVFYSEALCKGKYHKYHSIAIGSKYCSTVHKVSREIVSDTTFCYIYTF